MKKAITVILASLFCAFALACTAPPAIYYFDTDKPWGGNSTVSAYEKCTYDIVIRERVQSGKETTDGDVLARGTAVYTVDQKLDDGVMCTTLSLLHTITYEDIDKVGDDRGLTDVVESTVKFTTDGMAPVSSYKKQSYAPRKLLSGEYQEYVYDYETTADYKTLKASVKKNRNVLEDGSKAEEYNSVKEFNLKGDNQSFDNEQLYYIARALTGTKPKASESIVISNLYEIAENINKKGKYDTTKITISTAEELSVITLAPSFAKNYLEPAENGNYDVTTMRTSISRNDTYSGPSFMLYMSAPDVKFERKNGDVVLSSTNKVILRMVRTTYDLATREESSNIVYNLSDYTTDREN